MDWYIQQKERLRFSLKAENAAASVWTDYYEDAKRLSRILLELPMTPSGTLKAHMDRNNITVDGLVSVSGVSIRTIKRLRNDPYYRPTKENAIAICIGLQLEPCLQKDWLNKLGITLTFSPIDVLYDIILTTMFRQPLSTINLMLARYDIPPLSNGVDELLR